MIKNIIKYIYRKYNGITDNYIINGNNLGGEVITLWIDKTRLPLIINHKYGDKYGLSYNIPNTNYNSKILVNYDEYMGYLHWLSSRGINPEIIS